MSRRTTRVRITGYGRDLARIRLAQSIHGFYPKRVVRPTWQSKSQISLCARNFIRFIVFSSTIWVSLIRAAKITQPRVLLSNFRTKISWLSSASVRFSTDALTSRWALTTTLNHSVGEKDVLYWRTKWRILALFSPPLDQSIRTLGAIPFFDEPLVHITWSIRGLLGRSWTTRVASDLTSSTSVRATQVYVPPSSNWRSVILSVFWSNGSLMKRPWDQKWGFSRAMGAEITRTNRNRQIKLN